MAKHWKSWHSISLLLLILAIAAAGLLMPGDKIVWAWLVNIVALALFGMIAGDGITGNFWLGWLINEQNRMSLSRLQMALWTVVVLSAFLTAAMVNIKAGYASQALSIAIPQELWLAMGISTTSLVASPLILGKKRDKPANATTLSDAKNELGILPPDLENAHAPEGGAASQPAAGFRIEGQLVAKNSPRQAGLYDLISGEEIGNANVLDLTRLQNLLFTLIIVGSYAASLGASLNESHDLISQFPEIGAGSLALLAISHAGYLTAKTVDK